MSKVVTFGLDKSLGHPTEFSRTTSPTSRSTSGASDFNNPEDVTQILIGETKAGVRHTSFLKFRMNAIPHGSKINSAKIRLFGSSASSDGAIDIACLAPDDKWNHREYENVVDRKNPLWIPGNTSSKIEVQIRDSLNGMLGWNVNNGLFPNIATYRPFRQKLDLADGEKIMYGSNGAICNIFTGGTAQNIAVNVHRTASPILPKGKCGIRVWNVGADEQPTTILTETNTVNWSALPSTGGTFFVGTAVPNFAVTPGTFYFVEVYEAESKSYNPVESSGLVGMILTSGTARLGYENSSRTGFSSGGYMTRSDLPFLYTGNSGTAIHIPPLGDILTGVTLPGVGANEWTEVEGFKSIVQQAVDHPYYEKSGQQIGFVLESGDNFGINTEEGYTDFELVVEYTPRRISIT